MGLIVTVVVLVIAVAAATTIAVVQSRRLADSRDDVRLAEQQTGMLQQQVSDLEQQLAEAQQSPGQTEEDPQQSTSEDPLQDLFGFGDLDEMLEQLEEMLEDGDIGDVLGESLGDIDLGGGQSMDVSGCLTDVADAPVVDGSDVATQIDQTSAAVQAIRGLEFLTELDPVLLDGAGIRDRIEAITAEDYTAEMADVDRRILAALQAVDDGIDLRQVQLDLLGDQVLGFYDPDTGELVVRTDDPTQPLDLTELITVAHELEHALADEAIGLPDIDSDDDEDRLLAGLAVVEGDAVALQTVFQAVAIPPMMLLDALGTLGGEIASQQALDAAPPFIADSLTWPYTAGTSYVCDRFAEGGWEAVDAAIADPPRTTHEIMFPGSAAGPPADLHEPAGPAGFERVVQRTFGAAQLSWLFAAPGGDRDRSLPDPVGVTEAWRGGELTLWTSGEQSAVGLQIGDAGGLCQATIDWWRAAAGGPEVQVDPSVDDFAMQTEDLSMTGVIACPDGEVHIGIGPTPQIATDSIHS